MYPYVDHSPHILKDSVENVAVVHHPNMMEHSHHAYDPSTSSIMVHSGDEGGMPTDGASSGKRRGEWGVSENAVLKFAYPADKLREAAQRYGYTRKESIAWLRSKGVKKTTKLHCKQRPPRDSSEHDKEFCVSCAPLSMVVQVTLREAEGKPLTAEQWTLLAQDLMEINEHTERKWNEIFGKYGKQVPSFQSFVEKAGITMKSFYQRHHLGTFLHDMHLQVLANHRACQPYLQHELLMNGSIYRHVDIAEQQQQVHELLNAVGDSINSRAMYQSNAAALQQQQSMAVQLDDGAIVQLADQGVAHQASVPPDDVNGSQGGAVQLQHHDVVHNLGHNLDLVLRCSHAMMQQMQTLTAQITYARQDLQRIESRLTAAQQGMQLEQHLLMQQQQVEAEQAAILGHHGQHDAAMQQAGHVVLSVQASDDVGLLHSQPGVGNKRTRLDGLEGVPRVTEGPPGSWAMAIATDDRSGPLVEGYHIDASDKQESLEHTAHHHHHLTQQQHILSGITLQNGLQAVLESGLQLQDEQQQLHV